MSTVLKSETFVDRPSEEELVARARALIPMLRERAESVEKARCVSPETIDEFKRAGFFRILQPKRWGGWEMNPAVFMKVLMEVGRGCCSSGWNLMILGLHQWEFGLLDPQAGDDVWAEDSSVLVGSSYPPFGKLVKVDGGYQLSGTWRTSSGCDHAQWSFLGAAVHDEQGQVIDRIALLVPRSRYRIHDDWYVFGLAGTGSKSIILEETFVPHHRTHSFIDYQLSDRPAVYLYPFQQVFYGCVSAVIVGFAQGAIDLYTEQMKVRTDSLDGRPSALSPYVKDRLGNAVARVRSSRARLLNMMSETTELTQKRQLVPTHERVHHMLDIARVGRECEEAVLLLFKALSARGIYLSNPMQRVLRDTIAAANHITQNADDTAGMLGGYLLGQELPPYMFSRGNA